MFARREEVIEFIEIALVELRGSAQPRDFAELRELAMDARDAETPEQIDGILEHAKRLRKFCEERKESGGDVPSVFPARPVRRHPT